MRKKPNIFAQSHDKWVGSGGPDSYMGVDPRIGVWPTRLGLTRVSTMSVDKSSKCLYCQQPTIVGDRRLLAGHRVSSFWQSILVQELKIEQSSVERILETHPYMCRKCFRKFDEHIKEYYLMVSVLEEVAMKLNLSGIAGQKRTCHSMAATPDCSLVDTPVTKRPKPPLAFISEEDKTGKKSITTVSSG